jgi:hypothetical protein
VLVRPGGRGYGAAPAALLPSAMTALPPARLLCPARLRALPGAAICVPN